MSPHLLLPVLMSLSSPMQEIARVPAVDSGPLLTCQQLHYRTLAPGKPFPLARLCYYRNGVYRIVSEGEDHFGLYVMRGTFGDTTYSVHFVSLPSPDWAGRSAYHSLTFIDDGTGAGSFIQDAITGHGQVLDRQDGRFSTPALEQETTPAADG